MFQKIFMLVITKDALNISITGICGVFLGLIVLSTVFGLL